MPSHFHSAKKFRRHERGEVPPPSTACASMAGQNGAGSSASGAARGPRARRKGRDRAAPAHARGLRCHWRLAAELGDRLFGEPRRSADAQRARDELQKRPAAGFVQPVEKRGEDARQIDLASLRSGCATTSASDRRRAAARRSRPEQGDRLREIADEIIGEIEQDRIDALARSALWIRPGLAWRKDERAGQRRERKAAVGIGRGAEIIGHQPAVCRGARARAEAVEKLSETVYARLCASRRLVVAIAEHMQRLGRNSAPARTVHQRVRLAMRDEKRCAAGLDDRGAEPVPIGVIGNDERNSTPRWRARARTRIQPEAKAAQRVGEFAAQSSFNAPGGQSTISPARSARPATLRSSPSAMPRLA